MTQSNQHPKVVNGTLESAMAADQLAKNGIDPAELRGQNNARRLGVVARDLRQAGLQVERKRSGNVQKLTVRPGHHIQ